MKVLVIGSGGREHAIVWKLSQSKRAKKIYSAPGNPGTASLAENLSVQADDLQGILKAAREKKIDLVVVGSELPLTLGIQDLFAKEGIPLFGPSKAAAGLEGSKAFAKQLLCEAKVPTAHFEVFSDFDRAVDFLQTQSYPVVVKADGLAAGKGVLICKDRAETVQGLTRIMKGGLFGEAGRQVVIEEFLRGEEASFHALVDGESILPLASSQDHKRVRDHDEGPNTGGMGAISPTPLISKEMESQVLQEILIPTLRALRQRGIDYRGVLYAGLMLTASGPKSLEYNVRFGDPETQPILVRLEEDLLDLIEKTITGRLKGEALHWRPESSVCVVMAAHGYPGRVRTGDEISGLDRAEKMPKTVVFHSGTRQEGGKFLTSGGRVLGVTSCGKDLREARERAYDACEKIYWKGVHYRRDIGLKGDAP
ncbi:MAG: phosphoribosylamine--glycine ligase [Deltaproteobacteria bacterium]|nr:phosphoribosylamine--glycine ligase [Deltaproteobacteria bacterium]MBI4373963.1 phosphoribosylamine--glycine ligase [Deltaproteobacteria bacterium]